MVHRRHLSRHRSCSCVGYFFIENRKFVMSFRSLINRRFIFSIYVKRNENKKGSIVETTKKRCKMERTGLLLLLLLCISITIKYKTNVFPVRAA